MHAAPAVRVSFGRSWGWLLFGAACAGAAVANLGAWALLLAGWSAVPALALGALVAAMVLALGGRQPAPQDLAWDGAHWRWAGREGDVRVMLDLDGWMLLRFDAPGGPRCWIAASRRASRGPWRALRAALHSPRTADPPEPTLP